MVFRLLLAAFFGLTTTSAETAERPAAPVSPDAIQRTIEKARDWLIREQEANGSWECSMRTDDTRVGATSLVMLALANAGVERSHLAMQRGLDWLRRQQPDET